MLVRMSRILLIHDDPKERHEMELMAMMLGHEVVSSGAGFDLVIAPKAFPSQGAAHIYNAFPSPILRDILIAAFQWVAISTRAGACSDAISRSKTSASTRRR